MLDNIAVLLSLAISILAVLAGGWLVWSRRQVVVDLIGLALGVVITLFAFGYATDLTESDDTGEQRNTPVVETIAP